MPTWHPKPEVEMNDLLQEVLLELQDEIETMPSFISVVGIDSDRLIAHATDSISTIISGKSSTERAQIFSNPNMLIQIYMFGFVVGTRFGTRRTERSNQSPTQKE